MKLVADIELAIALFGTAGFVGLFWWHSDWRNPVGRSLLAFTCVLALLMALRLWSRVVWPLSDLFWMFGFGALDAAVAALLILLIRTQRRNGGVR